MTSSTLPQIPVVWTSLSFQLSTVLRASGYHHPRLPLGSKAGPGNIKPESPEFTFSTKSGRPGSPNSMTRFPKTKHRLASSTASSWPVGSFHYISKLSSTWGFAGSKQSSRIHAKPREIPSPGSHFGFYSKSQGVPPFYGLWTLP